MLNLIQLLITPFGCRCTTHHRLGEPESVKVTPSWLICPIHVPRQLRHQPRANSRGDVSGREAEPYRCTGTFLPGKSILGINFPSSLNMKAFKNVSRCMFVRVFLTNLSHKENVDYGSQELSYIW